MSRHDDGLRSSGATTGSGERSVNDRVAPTVLDITDPAYKRLFGKPGSPVIRGGDEFFDNFWGAGVKEMDCSCGET